MSYALPTENLEKLSEFIYRKSGLYLESNQYDKLQIFLNTHLKEKGFENFSAYFFSLRFDDKDGTLFQELINVVTVNDTHFCRESEHFKVLTESIMLELQRKNVSNRPIRILSAPCASGEEAYSILMHLLNDKNILNNTKIEVVGIDINSEMIAKAKDGIYSENSLRRMPQEKINDCFIKIEHEYKVNDHICSGVDFQVCNVYDKTQMHKLGKFDVIFSRNLLMYFDEASKKETAMVFHEMLNEGGYIFLGATESIKNMLNLFDTIKIDEVSFYKKKQALEKNLYSSF